MNLTIDNNTCHDIVYNGHYLKKLYFNNNLVWEKQDAHDYSQDYFTLESLEDGNTIGFYTENATPFSYSLDNGATWVQVNGQARRRFDWTMDNGDTVLLKANETNSAAAIYTFHCFATKTYNAKGNIMSLTNGDNFLSASTIYNDIFQGVFMSSNVVDASKLILPATTLATGCYYNMFNGCTSLVNAPELPATTLAQYCYQSMFNECTSLVAAPELPATTLASGCYLQMFYGCTSLVTAPELPATTLFYSCYEGMFKGCNSLVNAPVLPATTLAMTCYAFMFQGCTSLVNAPVLPATMLYSGCYQSMFQGCTSLKYIKAMFTTTPSDSYTKNWLYNVPSTGTFVKNRAATWTNIGTNAVPSGWTIQYASS